MSEWPHAETEQVASPIRNWTPRQTIRTNESRIQNKPIPTTFPISNTPLSSYTQPSEMWQSPQNGLPHKLAWLSWLCVLCSSGIHFTHLSGLLRVCFESWANISSRSSARFKVWLYTFSTRSICSWTVGREDPGARSAVVYFKMTCQPGPTMNGAL